MLYKLAPEYGVGVWEINCILLITIPALIDPFVYHQSYKGMGDELTSFLRMASKNGLHTGNALIMIFMLPLETSCDICMHYITGEEGKLYKRVKWRIIIFNGISIANAVFLTINNGFYFMADHYTFLSRCLICPISLIMAYWLGLPPITSGTRLFPYCLIKSHHNLQS